MPTDAIPLFYSFAHEDDALRKLLDTHLALLKRQGVISKWDEQDITAGNPRTATINKQLAAARIILVLISPDFMASDYCYGVEMQEALHRHEAGTAQVIPCSCDPAIGKRHRSRRCKYYPEIQSQLCCGIISIWPSLRSRRRSAQSSIKLMAQRSQRALRQRARRHTRNVVRRLERDIC